MNKERRKELQEIYDKIAEAKDYSPEIKLPISAPLQEVICDTLDLIDQIFCDDYCRHPRDVSARMDLTELQKDELLEALCDKCPLVNFL